MSDLTLKLLGEGRTIFILNGKIKSESIDSLDVNIEWNSGYGEIDDWLKRGSGKFHKSEKTLREAEEYLMAFAESKNMQHYQISVEVRR